MSRYERKVFMKTLDDLVEGSQVGYYSINIYLAILGIAGVVLLSVGLMNMQQERESVQKGIAQHYGIQKEGAQRVICHQGMLHYPNVNIFAGVIAYRPAITCTAEELESLQDSTYESLSELGLILIIVSTLVGFGSFITGNKNLSSKL